MVPEEILRPLPIFADCPAAELSRLAAGFTTAYYANCQAVYEENQPATAVYVVVQGEVELGLRIGDEYLKISLIGRGDIFGFGEIVFGQYYIGAVAVGKTRLLRMEKQTFLELFLGQPGLNLKLFTIMSETLKKWSTYYFWSAAETKLAHFLYLSVARGGRAEGNSLVVEQRFTHQQIADALSLTREYVTKMFNRLRKRGVLAVEARRLVIDKAWLERSVPDPELAASLRTRLYPGQGG